MKTSINTVFCLSALIFLALSSAASGQTHITEQLDLTVTKVIEESGRHFRDGLTAFHANKRPESGEKFNKAVEAFLYSTLNIQKDQKLLTCYSQLIETVYRLEFPSDAQAPQIRPLSAACGWAWNDEDFKLADTVAAMVRTQPKNSASDKAILASVAPAPGQQQPAES